tara:strand:+ start:1070 stop:1768 length:699 start_codon:yes stop_codon:yes gene_type:complete
MIKVYYRLSNQNAGRSKIKLPHATKQHCLENCIKEFGLDNITVIGDKLNQETLDYLNSLGIRLVQVNNGTGSDTFRDALNLALKENSDQDFIYLLEDDFLHKPNSKNLLIEGLSTYNSYVTLYDHPDKYLSKEQGGNPFVEQGGEVTRVVMSANSHWKITNSTVMSFVASVSRLKQDKDLLYKYSSNSITDSFKFFQELSQTKGVACISPLPGVSTHVETAWLTPLTNWSKI